MGLLSKAQQNEIPAGNGPDNDALRSWLHDHINGKEPALLLVLEGSEEGGDPDKGRDMDKGGTDIAEALHSLAGVFPLGPLKNIVLVDKSMDAGLLSFHLGKGGRFRTLLTLETDDPETAYEELQALM